MPPTVLIVDDDAVLCENLAAYLEDEDMQVHTCHSGEQALQQIRAGLPVDVCIMDLRLPGMNGAEAILAIHADAPQVHFIIHTGSAHEAVTRDLYNRGLNGIAVFKKPVEDTAVLAEAVSGLCSTVQSSAG
jgi:CheY-like chemotaxis protein